MNERSQWQNFYGLGITNALEAAPVETPIVWMPADRQQRAVSFHNAMLVFQNDMARAKEKKQVPEGQLDAWRKFRDEWAQWYGLASLSTWIFSSTDSILDGYEKALAGWRDWYAHNVATPSGQGPSQYVNTPLIPSAIEVKTPDLDPQKNMGAWLWLGGFSLAAVVAYSYWKKGGGGSGRPTQLAGLDYPGSHHLFDQGGKAALDAERKSIRRAAARKEISWSDAAEHIRDLEHDWYHYNHPPEGSTEW